MSLHYTFDKTLGGYRHLMAQHMDWFRQLNQVLCYPEAVKKENLALPDLPDKFEDWLNILIGDEYVHNDEAARLRGLHSQLDKMSGALVYQVRAKGEKISSDQYKGMAVIFNEFIKTLQQVDSESHIRNLGVDPRTGLKTRQAMYIDIQQELDKIARKGAPFALAMVRIDFFQKIIQQEGSQNARVYQKMVGETILEALRSYDDAYWLENGEFLLFMKQSDLYGAMSALQRLYALLIEKKIMITLDEGQRILTVSSCIAEPYPEDDVDQLLAFLREDLKQAKEGSGSLLAYADITPIERYANAIHHDLAKDPVDLAAEKASDHGQ